MSYTLSTQYRALSQNARIRYLVIHYTAVEEETSLQLLTQGSVSAHYLIPAKPSTPGLVYQLVAESQRAWHAGASGWQGSSALNDSSIGIELVNLGFTETQGEKHWFPYPASQIDTLIALVKDILQRHTIHASCVVGHSDIAPDRKQDPGPLFPWKTLFEHGIGAWPDETTVHRLIPQLQQQPLAVTAAQQLLHDYGYPIAFTGKWDAQTRDVIRALQMHFRPSNISGDCDAETSAILINLVERYPRHCA